MPANSHGGDSGSDCAGGLAEGAQCHLVVPALSSGVLAGGVALHERDPCADHAVRVVHRGGIPPAPGVCIGASVRADGSIVPGHDDSAGFLAFAAGDLGGRAGVLVAQAVEALVLEQGAEARPLGLLAEHASADVGLGEARGDRGHEDRAAGLGGAGIAVGSPVAALGEVGARSAHVAADAAHEHGADLLVGDRVGDRIGGAGFTRPCAALCAAFTVFLEECAQLVRQGRTEAREGSGGGVGAGGDRARRVGVVRELSVAAALVGAAGDGDQPIADVARRLEVQGGEAPAEGEHERVRVLGAEGFLEQDVDVRAAVGPVHEVDEAALVQERGRHGEVVLDGDDLIPGAVVSVEVQWEEPGAALGVVDVDRDGLRGRRVGEPLDPSAESSGEGDARAAPLCQADQRSLVQQLEAQPPRVGGGEGGVGGGARHTSGVVLAYDDATPVSWGHQVNGPPYWFAPGRQR